MLAERTQSDLQSGILAIWSEVLDDPSIGLDDDFLALGGNSLLATMVASRLRDRHRVDVPVGTLFAAPTVAQFTVATQALLDSGRVHAAPLNVVRVDRDVPLRLSAPQERMWFLHRMQPDGTAYNLEQALRLRGPLCIESLQWGFDRLFERHESLRTSFFVHEGLPVQRIAPTYTAEIPVIDCSRLSPNERLPFTVGEMQRVITTPFELAALPLIRTVLYRLDDEDHVLLVAMHHIISDHWSLGLLTDELAELYNSHRAGSPYIPDALEHQHADYAASYSRWLDDGVLDTQIDYWRRQLADLSPCDLPTDFVRPAIRTSNGAAIIVPFADDLASRTTELAHRHNASPFMVLLACHQLLLHRYTGRDDIAVGSPIANRNWLASENLISTFVNTLVMRTDLSGDPSFDELVDRVKSVALAAYAHQDLPFDRLVSELRPPHDPSRSPFFQTFFNLQNAPMTIPELDGLTAEAVRFDLRSAQFDVSLTIDSVRSKTLALEYNTDLYGADHMERMLGHYLTLLDAALTTPERPISGLTMLTPDEVAAIEAAEHATDAEYDRHACVHDLVADQAHRTPNANAVTFDDDSLTYAELDTRATSSPTI